MYWLTIFLLQAATPADEQIISDGDLRQMQMVAQSREAAAIEQARTLKPDALEQALRDALSDRTRMIYSQGHGIRVEYTSPDGALRLWYPGGRQVALGQWGVQRFKKKLINACFRYRPAEAAGAAFAASECAPAEQTLSAVNVLRDWRGDVFALTSGRIPYVKAEMGMPSPAAH